MSSVSADKLRNIITSFCPDLIEYEKLYRYLHQNGELSKCEQETAQLIASHLHQVSPALEVKTGIGGHGVVAIFRNGPGKTVLLRADIDALPVQERTSLPYESTKTMVDAKGNIKPVMHACGHDFHTICGLAAAETVVAASKSWSGTCIFLFQPAEETITGARAMVEDGLFDEARHGCPIPDALLAQHVIPLPAGFIGSRAGPTLAASDSFDVLVHGRGGHGSMPHCTIDPVVIVSQIVIRLQTIVSREVDPTQPVVVTVGSITAGDVPNVIPDQARLKINIRSYDLAVREKVIASIHRIVTGECEAGGCHKPPEVQMIETVPFLHNDQDLHNHASSLFATFFGDRYIPDIPAFPGSEDFGIFGAAINRPSYFWFFGGYEVDPVHRKDSLEQLVRQFPINHSPLFAPVLQPTLQTGVHAAVVGILSIVGIITQSTKS